VRPDRPDTVADWAHSQFITWSADRPVVGDALSGTVDRRRRVLAS
jgi:hypothetical protein